MMPYKKIFEKFDDIFNGSLDSLSDSAFQKRSKESLKNVYYTPLCDSELLIRFLKDNLLEKRTGDFKEFLRKTWMFCDIDINDNKDKDVEQVISLIRRNFPNFVFRKEYKLLFISSGCFKYAYNASLNKLGISLKDIISYNSSYDLEICHQELLNDLRYNLFFFRKIDTIDKKNSWNNAFLFFLVNANEFIDFLDNV